MVARWLNDLGRRAKREVDDLDEQQTGKAGCVFDGCCLAGCLLDALTAVAVIVGAAAVVGRLAAAVH